MVEEDGAAGGSYLGKGNRTREEFDKVAGLEDDIRVVRLACRLYGHGTLYQIERRIDAMWREGGDDVSPYFTKVMFAVFGE
jgi:hypothetical protein